MGNREALLAGATRCLYERGYARTTARDVAAAAGVSLAGIGYHFGSLEALLNAALVAAIGAWGDELGRALAAAGDPASGSLERFEATWTRVVESFPAHRPLLVASFEAFAQIDRAPEVRRVLAEALQQGRTGLAALSQNLDEDAVDGAAIRTVGSFSQALLTGVIAQWLVDPARAPSGRDLADALRRIVAAADPAGPGATAGRRDTAAPDG
jgi:AcrR family transcriptional regulator